MNQDEHILKTNNNDAQLSRNLIDTIDRETKDSTPWFAIRLFGGRSNEVADFFKDNEVETFIPMRVVDYLDRNEKIRHALRPVVRNLLFVKKTMSVRKLNKLMRDSGRQMMVFRKTKGSAEYYEIPAKQMLDFRIMCNPEFAKALYLSGEEAQIKIGDPVLVSHGPLKGITGRLVRQNKKYYLLKEVPGIGVMVKVSRWCCKPMPKTHS